ncbi:MAG: surface antigen variable number repeat family protein, partial [Moraxellaceae bacterium]|nr:surface antigen variable number repeat family protein [Moraxellaceae bacterium]
MPYRHSFRCRPAIAGGLLLLHPLWGAAETPPDAGQLQERSREPVTVQPLAPPRIEAPAPAASAADATAGPAIVVQRLSVTGATIIPTATLEALVADAVGQRLGFAELHALAARLTRHYQAQGYLLARAYLPPQEIRDGVVEIAVLEGRLENVRSEDSARLPESLRTRLSAGLATGRPVQRADLERAVLLHDTLPGIAASARLRPGAQPGGTEIVLQTQRDNAVSGEATLDNHGDRYTGDLQGGLRLEWNNPTHSGDQLALRLQGTGAGRLYGRTAYDFSLYGPWRATIAASSTRYELGEEFRNLEADGWARTGSLELRYPLVLTPGLRVALLVGGDHMRLVDRIGIAGSERNKDLTQGRLGLALQGADRWRGQSALSLQASSGRVDIHDPAEQAFDAISVGSEGGFSKVNLQGERWQQLPGGFQLRGSASLQRALNNLASAQKLAIGGPNGVRAYPTGEAQGDDGQLVSLELRRALPIVSRWQPTAIAFADYGRVHF